MKCTLVVLNRGKKATCKSRPGHLVSSAWCLWIVHECGIHLLAKNGFQYLWPYGRFSKIQSHIIIVLKYWKLWNLENVGSSSYIFTWCTYVLIIVKLKLVKDQNILNIIFDIMIFFKYINLWKVMLIKHFDKKAQLLR